VRKEPFGSSDDHSAIRGKVRDGEHLEIQAPPPIQSEDRDEGVTKAPLGAPCRDDVRAQASSVKKPLDTETHAWGKYQHTNEEDKSEIAITRNPTPLVARASRTQTEPGHIAITCNSTPPQPPHQQLLGGHKTGGLAGTV